MKYHHTIVSLHCFLHRNKLTKLEQLILRFEPTSIGAVYEDAITEPSKLLNIIFLSLII